MRIDFRRGESGYTIVELMVAVTITLFVMAGVYGLMLQNQHIYEQQTRIADVQQTARVALDMMTREIRMAGGDPTQSAFESRAACVNGNYKWPADPKVPAADDVAPITVATASKIRVKMDRPTWSLPPEPPPHTNPNIDTDVDGLYDKDDEFKLGDGFVNDEGEDITFEYDSATKTLYRIENRTLVPSGACRTSASTAAATTVTKTPIADHVVDLKFSYYDQYPPKAACPATASFNTAAEYETAKDLCDVPLATVTDMTAIQRVRIRVTVETDKPDHLAPKTSPKFGRQWITLASETTVRNR